MVSVRFRFLKKSSVSARFRFSQSQKLRLRFGFGLHEKWPENRVFGFGSVNRSFPMSFRDEKLSIYGYCIVLKLYVLMLLCTAPMAVETVTKTNNIVLIGLCSS